MKRFLAIALTASLGLFAGSAAAVTVGDYNAGDAASGIAGSRHNLGSLGVHLITGATSQICVFCHTPHHTVTGNGVAPLWNRSTTNSASYTAYGPTISGSNIADTDLGSSTLACLSCHDGVTTFDNLVNRPGKDTRGSTTGLGWAFSEDGTSVSNWITSGRLTIGPSLSNDHPVSVAYTEGWASLRASATNIAAIDLSSSLSATIPSVMQNLWSVKGYFNTDATIGDLLRVNPNVTGATVECGSCHDPHFSNKSYDEVEWTWGTEADADGLFLRRVGGNEASGVCRTCHNK